jgi:phenylpropionate dioxygenase-like ring-hydroxylating dioxygenase large terminal subunit
LLGKPDKSTLGLQRVPRVESWRGLIFGSFDPEIIPLEEYLGDMRFYLDAFLGRFPEGIEFMRAPHRWLLDANWKLPVENQLGDVNHRAFLHSAIIPREAQDLIEQLGFSVVTSPGHGATFRLMPEDAPHPELPGLVSVTANEFYAPHFFVRWRDDLQAVEGKP